MQVFALVLKCNVMYFLLNNEINNSESLMGDSYGVNVLKFHCMIPRNASDKA